MCRVANTRWPVSAAVSAVTMVSSVAHLADEDHVGVLAQHVAKRLRERLRVSTYLALVDDRAVVSVEELDRVLDRSRCEAVSTG